MMRLPVGSTRVSAIGYDRDRNALEVEFPDGAVFCYYNVPRQLYVDLITAGSIGRFFDAHIKGLYDHEKVS